ncbi:MAG: hypothetical protein HY901_00960, partial [Deltaproteobacteria bacterium]|nr:hypothetical protein [Deltaproteobacteria bacterium]
MATTKMEPGRVPAALPGARRSTDASPARHPAPAQAQTGAPPSTTVSPRENADTFCAASKKRPALLEPSSKGVERSVRQGPAAPSSTEADRVLGRWETGGLHLERAKLGPSLSATLSRPMSWSQLAAAAFDIPEGEVSARHLSMLAGANPALPGPASAPQHLEAGTSVALAATPAGMRLAAQLLDSARAGALSLAAQGSLELATPLSQAELIQLSEAQRQLSTAASGLLSGAVQADGESLIGRAEARAAKPASEGNTAAVLEAFDGARVQVRQAVPGASGRPAQGTGALEVKTTLAESFALEQCAAAHVKRCDVEGVERVLEVALGRLDRALASPDLDFAARTTLTTRKAALHVNGARALATLPAFAVSSGAKATRAVDLKPLDAKISSHFDSAETELEALEQAALARVGRSSSSSSSSPAVALEQVRSLLEEQEALRHSVRADLHGAANDTPVQLSELELCLGATLGLSPDPSRALLAPDEERSIASDGKERPWYRLDKYLTATTVGFLSRPKLEDAAGRIGALPPARQERALAALANLAGAAGGAGDVSRMNTARQLLSEVASRLERPELRAQAALADGLYLQSVGDAAGARSAFSLARKQASAMVPSSAREGLEATSLLREASALCHLAESAEQPQRLPNAAAIRGLREEAEAQGLGGPELGARLGLVEIEGYLAANQAKAAQETLDHLRRSYGADPRTPWVRSALDKVEKESRDSPAVAFLQVALAEANSESMGEALGDGVGGSLAGAAAGAAIGAWFFGVGAIPGAAVGAIAGGGIGVGSLKARNLWRGAGNIQEASQTGLNSRSWQESLLDTTMLAVDVASVFAPLKGMQVAGKGGLTALSGYGSAATRREAEALMAGFTARVERAVANSMGPEALASMSRSEITSLGKDMLLREMAKESAAFGGGASVAALGALAAQFSKALYDIQASSLPEETKAAERSKLWRSMAQTGIGLGLNATLAGAAYRYALNPTAGSQALRQALREVDPRTPTAVALDSEEFARFVALRKLELEGRGLSTETVAQLNSRYDAIARHQVAAFDPVTGDVVVNRQALDQPFADSVLAHEVSHLRFHQLGPKELDEVVGAFTRHPRWQEIQAEGLRAHPEAKGFSASQLVDELLATAHGDPGGASPLTRLIQPILDSAPLQRAQLDQKPTVDLEALRNSGDVSLGGKRYLGRSGETGLVGHSDAGPDAAQLRTLLEQWSSGSAPKMVDAEVKALQASALQVIDRTFLNTFGNDGGLRQAVSEKLGHYSAQRRGSDFDDVVFGGQSIKQQQTSALRYVLHTFSSPGEGDTALRREVAQKLGEIGTQADVPALLRLVRKGNSSDLYHGLEAAKSIARREGSPQLRGPLAKDPEIGPLLAKRSLTEAERARALEAIMTRGEIDYSKTVEHKGTNLNSVYFLTFKESLPGPQGTRVPVRAVWKPERTWQGKDRSFYAREVAAYEFDKQFAKTGMVPPTVEGILAATPGGSIEVGSLQWMIPESRPIGMDPKPYLPKIQQMERNGDVAGANELKK